MYVWLDVSSVPAFYFSDSLEGGKKFVLFRLVCFLTENFWVWISSAAGISFNKTRILLMVIHYLFLYTQLKHLGKPLIFYRNTGQEKPNLLSQGLQVDTLKLL